ncbi:7026_t:CDS:2 [Ambispora gerdemannii]|uniref:7026_t:CDS:1 n=1 Tax=Ambispora gerdemannii TaxID=144530 RepID=A0A9N9ADC7_9GLOM|nr:7026_t:CDS:2 [Ambispora gerdemannii]
MGNCTSQCFGKRNKGGYTLGGGNKTEVASSSYPLQTEAALAAERRAEQAKTRGVQKGGGKLSKKLEEQQKSANKFDEKPSNDNLQWRVD